MMKTLAAQRNSKAFEFNTYMIAFLVMFFLQMNYGMPTVGGSPLIANQEEMTEKTTAKSTTNKIKDLNKMVADFFHFYGGR